MANKIEDIRKKCIEANPFDMGENHECVECNSRLCVCPWRNDSGNKTDYLRPIRLADVLLVLRNEVPKFHQQVVLGTEGATKTIGMWNLKDNNLENQSEETINFIHGLLYEK